MNPVYASLQEEAPFELDRWSAEDPSPAAMLLGGPGSMHRSGSVQSLLTPGSLLEPSGAG